MDGNLISFPDDLQRSVKAKLIGYTIPHYLHTLSQIKKHEILHTMYVCTSVLIQALGLQSAAVMGGSVL